MCALLDITSYVEHPVNAKASTLCRQNTTVVTFDGSFLSYWAKNLLEMSQKWQVTNTDNKN